MEQAEQSKWLNFELRTYNADLGRFNNPDPYSQFASAYVGMGNNPVSGVDPTGGFVNFDQSGDGSFALPGRVDMYISYGQYYKNVVLANAYSMQSYERDFQNLSRKYYPRTWYNGREEINSPEGNNVLAYRHELFALQASYGINPMTTGIANSGIDFDATADAYTYKVWGDIDRAKRDEFYAEKAARREAFEQKKREATQKAAEMLAKMFPANVDLMASLGGGSNIYELNDRALFHFEYLNMTTQSVGASNLPVVFDTENSNRPPDQHNEWETKFYAGNSVIINVRATLEPHGADIFNSSGRDSHFDPNKHYFRYYSTSDGINYNIPVYGSVPRTVRLGNTTYNVNWPR